MTAVLAQFVGSGIVGWLLTLIIVAAVIAIVVVAVRAMGLVIPPWAVQIFWICIIACVAIFAIKIVLSM